MPLLPARLYRGTDVATNPANRKPLATGPFRLAAWEGGTLRLVRNTQYFGTPPACEQVVLRVVPESASAFQGARTGALDESRLTAVQRAEAGEGLVAPRGARTTRSPTRTSPGTTGSRSSRTPRVRRALTMLIDRETIARTLYGGLARPANGPLPPGLWPHDPTLAPLPVRPGAGGVAPRRGRLAQGEGRRPDAGRADGSPSRSRSAAASDRQRQIVERRSGPTARPGSRWRSRRWSGGRSSRRSTPGDYEACSLSLNLDPNPDLRPNWHSSQVPPNGMNHSFYRNPRADALMDELATTFDREKARALYAELQRVIADDQPFTFLHTVSVAWGVRDRVREREDVTGRASGSSGRGRRGGSRRGPRDRSETGGAAAA